MGGVHDVVHDGGRVGPHREVDDDVRPRRLPVDLRNSRQRPFFRETGVPEEDPDEAVADADRIAPQAHRRKGVPEELVGDGDQAAVDVVGPAVIATGEPAAFHAAGRQLDLAVRAVVLDRGQPPVAPPEERQGRMLRCHLDHLAGPDVAVVLDRIPVGRIEPGRPRLSPQRRGVETHVSRVRARCATGLSGSRCPSRRRTWPDTRRDRAAPDGRGE